jgi:nucleoid DNA-binding protein
VARKTGYTRRSISKIIKAAFKEIRAEGHLEYRGFGVFKRIATPERVWTTPWDGDMGVSLSKSKLTFKESKPNRHRRKKV